MPLHVHALERGARLFKLRGCFLSRAARKREFCCTELRDSGLMR